jgi:glycine/D-amino acid oxidase-like deaminating enzyme
MLLLPKEQNSYWQASAKAAKFSELKKDLETDVVISGGGIAGLTCAYVLKKTGYKVAVLEKNTIGSGTTSKTTGKITSQHSLIYDELIKRHGKGTARIYANANEEALTKILQLIKKEKIDCDLEIDNNFVFTTEENQINKFKAEAKAASTLGLPASFQTKSDLPFKIKAAVQFSNQAKFNVQKYILALAKLVNGQGSHVFESSEVTYFHDGEQPYVKSNGYKVFAKYIIVATKIPAAPLIARGSYGFMEYPHTSYIIAGEYSGKLKGMYISPDKYHYSILPVNSNDKRYLLIGGKAHIPGLGSPHKRYQKLAGYAAEHFGITSIEHTWKGMDYIAYDNIPLIGKLYPWSKNIYVATGFKKWGLTTSMVAAIILRDTILGTKNLWTDTFSSIRPTPFISIPYKIAKSISS